MTTPYFTFSQSHIHCVNGKTLDKDCAVKITADDPREIMFQAFGSKWACQYDEGTITKAFMEHFPRGIIELEL